MALNARDELLVTVASLYYEQSYNQQQIADQLDVSRSSVSRMIKEARDRGIVDIHIHRPLYRDTQNEQELVRRFGLRDARVLRTQPLNSNAVEGATRLQALGRLAATYLEQVVEGLPPQSTIGIAWGTAAHASVNALSQRLEKGIDVVQLLGSVGAPQPNIDGPDLARALASKLGGRHYYLHAPAFVEQPGLREMLYRESTVHEAMKRVSAVQVALTGIGAMDGANTSYVRAGHMTVEQIKELHTQGVVGEMCGSFYDIYGHSEPYEINQHVVGIDSDALRAMPHMIAVAFGERKVRAIGAALRGHYPSVLITDHETAEGVLALAD